MTNQYDAETVSSTVSFEEEPIQTRMQAEVFCENFETAMDNLVDIIEAETELLREGQISELPTVAPKKHAAIESYLSGIRVASANAIALGNLAPLSIQRMRERHGNLRPILQTNLQVVSTARSVTDNVIETVAKAVGSQMKTRGYGANGMMSSPQRSAQGIAVNQTL
ncbi:hypothetical protein PsAD13_04342 [Pseudovibrio sp. Ad13]|uniref:Flagellar protein FlgN n=1 Tax=Pseudovibrio ascidiaceicola TaxID=285279 RepID=A0A1I4CBB4_9HYPH|nr:MULTISPECIES: hypothetical protein [Pseudovibrio]KZK81391.1 hypothetical protein PsAD13_04342 [Pseudovibrio sp. Ad13]KZL14886.1 hypothetical protein PsAD37_04644 [Pseudovibrio sp. Ad37]SFK78488.1 hypothetical protein SAMN04488518_10961 [Pseudovibrio ascidiaceicola]